MRTTRRRATVVRHPADRPRLSPRPMLEKTERQASRRLQHLTLRPALTDGRPDVAQPLGLPGDVVHFEIEVDPGAMITNLPMHVEVPFGRFEAAKVRLPDHASPTGQPKTAAQNLVLVLVCSGGRSMITCTQSTAGDLPGSAAVGLRVGMRHRFDRDRDRTRRPQRCRSSSTGLESNGHGVDLVPAPTWRELPTNRCCMAAGWPTGCRRPDPPSICSSGCPSGRKRQRA